MMSRYGVVFLLIFSSFANASRDLVLMEGKGVQVVGGDINEHLKYKVPERYRYEVMTEATEIEKLVRQVYQRKVLEKEAYELGLDKIPDVQKLLAQATSLVLAKSRLDYLSKNQEESVNWDLVAKEEYYAYPNRYKAPAAVHVSHILISREKHGEAELKQLAEELHTLASSESKLFEQLAERFSEGSSAKKGGDLGFIRQGQMVKPFEQAAFKLRKSGELSPIVETKFGMHIIKLHERKEVSTIPYEQVKSQIIEKKKKQLRSRLIDEHIESIFVNATTHRDVIKSLQKPYKPPSKQ